MAENLERTGTIHGNYVLDLVIAHANRYSADRIGDVIDTLELYGNPNEDIEETAVGNYIADRMLAEGIAPALYVINMGDTVAVVNPRNREIIASASIANTTLQEVHYLIEEGAPGFEHLNADPEPTGFPGDHPDNTLVTLHGPIRPTDSAFLDCVTALTVYDF